MSLAPTQPPKHRDPDFRSERDAAVLEVAANSFRQVVMRSCGARSRGVLELFNQSVRAAHKAMEEE